MLSINDDCLDIIYSYLDCVLSGDNYLPIVSKKLWKKCKCEFINYKKLKGCIYHIDKHVHDTICILNKAKLRFNSKTNRVGTIFFKSITSRKYAEPYLSDFGKINQMYIEVKTDNTFTNDSVSYYSYSNKKYLTCYKY